VYVDEDALFCRIVTGTSTLGIYVSFTRRVYTGVITELGQIWVQMPAHNRRWKVEERVDWYRGQKGMVEKIQVQTNRSTQPQKGLWKEY
jgi:hypothetical protein